MFGYRYRWLRMRVASVAVIGAAVMAAPVIPGLFPGAGAESPYFLYFSFDIPLVLPSVVLSDSGTQQLYAGTLRGTLGGLPLRSATLQYGPGPSKVVGGGTFTLTTPAGTVRDGHILMSNNGQQTVLLFFGMYLGGRLEFSVTSDREQIGGTGVTATGLARTGFLSHEEYRAAVEKAIAPLDPAARDQILTQVDENLRLVNAYQQKQQ